MILAHGLDELARVVPLCALHQCSHDVRAETLAVAHDGVLRLLREVVYEVHAEVDGTQLLEERVDDVEELFAFARVGDDSVYHLVVAFHHSLKFVLPRLVALLCEQRCGDELIGDAAQGAHYDDDRLLLRLFLYDSLKAENTLYGTH